MRTCPKAGSFSESSLGYFDRLQNHRKLCQDLLPQFTVFLAEFTYRLGEVYESRGDLRREENRRDPRVTLDLFLEGQAQVSKL